MKKEARRGRGGGEEGKVGRSYEITDHYWNRQNRHISINSIFPSHWSQNQFFKAINKSDKMH